MSPSTEVRQVRVRLGLAIGLSLFACSNVPEDAESVDEQTERGSDLRPFVPATDGSAGLGQDARSPAPSVADGSVPATDIGHFGPAPDAGHPVSALDAVAPPGPPADVGAPPPPPPPLPPPAATPPAPPPNASAAVSQLVNERRDLFDDACVEQGGHPEFQRELLRRLRTQDARWGFISRDGELLWDRLGYFYGAGPPEGSAEAYVIDYIVSYCARAGVDAPSSPGWQDDTAAGGNWTLSGFDGAPPPPPPDADAGGPAPVLPLPDERGMVQALADERPDLLAASCVQEGGNNDFLYELVRRLRVRDVRWGLNWKRGNVGDMSQDVVDYFWAEGEPEGRTEVYIIDVIGSHCSPEASAAFTDVTESTRLGGTIGRWTLQPLPP